MCVDKNDYLYPRNAHTIPVLDLGTVPLVLRIGEYFHLLQIAQTSAKISDGASIRATLI